jgi:hypothetical protein
MHYYGLARDLLALVLNVSIPYTKVRWGVFAFLSLTYVLHIVAHMAWYLVAYCLYIYMLSAFLLFITPLYRQSTAESATSPDALPQTEAEHSDEFRPFMRKLPEFQFWHKLTKAQLIAWGVSLLPFTDLPVYWPILAAYFIGLTVYVLAAEAKKWRAEGYVPFDFLRPLIGAAAVRKTPFKRILQPAGVVQPEETPKTRMD